MSEQIIASKIPTFASEQTQKSTRGFGQNGYTGPSSVTPGQARTISKQMADVSPPTCVIPANKQTRDAGKSKLATTPTMHSPNKAGDKVPGVSSRRDKTGVTRPTR
jgi:hypothetical protein